MTESKLRFWEIALLFALAAALMWGSWSLQQQDRLERKMIRLHVIANSDSEADQALKLQVRDRVLTLATDILRRADSREQAERDIEAALPDLQAAAADEIAAQGYSCGVTARLERAEFPEKDYDGFSLPAGEYLALRVVIGEGQGRNWWCVVFPSLCTAATSQEVAEYAQTGGFDADETQLITGGEEEYELRFKTLEWLQKLRDWLR